MRLIQVNSVIESGSTGRIVSAIEDLASERGHQVVNAFGRGDSAAENSIQIGNQLNVPLHGVRSFLDDGHGLGSRLATSRFVTAVEKFRPDVVGLHNIHGYFLHYPTIFEYLQRSRVPVVWTLHDCWPFTGHCSYFDRVNCHKWEEECFDCPMTSYYPRSLVDRSTRNFRLKKRSFAGLTNLVLVTPSEWLKGLVERSFLASCSVRVIHNGVDIEVFKPAKLVPADILVLGVASIWSDRKGLADFVWLRQKLPAAIRIALVGLSKSQEKCLPKGIESIAKTADSQELATWYQKASVFVNPTYSDNFPTTNIESLACGTPVVTYAVGGSPEALDNQTGRIVPVGNRAALAESIVELINQDHRNTSINCRKRAVGLFSNVERFGEYIDLCESLVGTGSLK